MCFMDNKDYYSLINKLIVTWDHMRSSWNLEADRSLSMYQYLKQNIHNA
jgi:hypothetical protein